MPTELQESESVKISVGLISSGNMKLSLISLSLLLKLVGFGSIWLEKQLNLEMLPFNLGGSNFLPSLVWLILLVSSESDKFFGF